MSEWEGYRDFPFYPEGGRSLGWFAQTQAPQPTSPQFIPTMVWSNNLRSNTEWRSEGNSNWAPGAGPEQHYPSHPQQASYFTNHDYQQYCGQEEQVYAGVQNGSVNTDYPGHSFHRPMGNYEQEPQYPPKYPREQDPQPTGFHQLEDHRSHYQQEKRNSRQRTDTRQESEDQRECGGRRGEEGSYWQEEGNLTPRTQLNRSGVDRLYRHPRHYYTHRNSGNLPSTTHFSTEEKSEGRRKLLEEAASLLSDQNAKEKHKTNNKYDHQGINFWRANNLKEGSSNNNNKRESKCWRDKQDSVCQRERLEEQLRRGSLECLVCCERIRQVSRVWSCSNCHHVLHLKCITKWAATSKAENGWRCPACQNVTEKIPVEYKCMCGKVTEPQWVRGETPHCCGQVCGKTSNCVHQCTLLCHPGPCPPCSANTTRKCGCNRTSQTVLCSSSVPIICDAVCGKKLNCTVHFCEEKCHNNPCQPCAVILKQECWCGESKREVLCDEVSKGEERFSCEGKCGGKLECGEHGCERACHRPPCGVCPLSPARLANCPCGRTRAPPGRISCLEPVHTCGEECGKPLECGHACVAACHLPPCPPCLLTTTLHCRCTRISQDIPCKDVTCPLFCNKRCTKKRSCGKHKCNQNCCVDEEHICPLVCNKTLSCGRHKCQLLCHRGHCPPCSNLSFEELRCECGSEVVLPPVACGTRPPECKNPCPREHPCNHVPTHNCHSQPVCPPCTVLQVKHCHGKHELRKSVACHVGEFSCGRECGRKVECGHKCSSICHSGECATPCRRSCQTARAGCGHPCSLPCHYPAPCPKPPPPCSSTVRLSCPCGRRTASRACSDHSAEYKRVATALLARTMADVQLGRSVHPTDLTASASNISLKTLECNEDCKTYERNLRLAIGLQIVNPDLNSKLSPRYPESMKAWAKRDPRLCQLVHDKLTQLVLLAKQSKQKSRSYSFDPMNRDKRQFVHEYCKQFGCESVAYDTEPKRNIVATAYKDKCWLPSYSLLEVVQRENGQRKVPLPSLKKDTVKDLQMKRLERVQSKQPPEGEKSGDPTPPIDYFDYTSSTDN